MFRENNENQGLWLNKQSFACFASNCWRKCNAKCATTLLRDSQCDVAGKNIQKKKNRLPQSDEGKFLPDWCAISKQC